MIESHLHFGSIIYGATSARNIEQIGTVNTVQEQKLNISKKMTSTEASTFPY